MENYWTDNTAKLTSAVRLVVPVFCLVNLLYLSVVLKDNVSKPDYIGDLSKDLAPDYIG